MKKLLLTVSLLAAVLSAGEFDFTAGRVKNFRAMAAKKASFTAGKGFISENGGRLVGTGLSLDAALIDRIVVITDDSVLRSAKLYFDLDGKNFAESKMVRGRQIGTNVVFSLRGHKDWQGKIGALRFDLRSENDTFTVKKIIVPKNVPGIPASVDFAVFGMCSWRVTGADKLSFVPGKGMDVVNRRSVRLLSPKVNIDAAKCDVIELSVAGNAKSFKLYFTAGKTPFAEKYMVRGIKEGSTAVFDLSKNPHWKGNFELLRIDIHSDSGSEFTIKGIRFLKGDGANAVRSPFRHPVSIAPGKSVAGTCEFFRPVPLEYHVNTTAPVVVNMVYKDVYGNVNGNHKLTLPAGKSKGEFFGKINTGSAEMQVVNTGSKTAEFQMKLFQEQTVPVKARGKKVYRAGISGFPANSDENSVVTPEVIFPAEFPAGKELVLRLKGAGDVDIIAADQVVSGVPGKSVKLPKLFFRYLSSGKYTVSAYIDDVECSSSQVTFTHERKSPVIPPQARIARNNSRPYYIINGSEIADPLEHLSSDPPLSRWAMRQVFNAVDNGIESIRLRLIFRFDEKGNPDFSNYDNTLQAILLRAPHVNVMFHVSVTDPGPKWRGAHPEEGIKDDKGEFRIRNYRTVPEATSSMASVRWVEDSKTMLRALIAHLNTVPCGERVIGILPCSGITWEWLHWGSARGVFVDYSEHYRQYFISFLRKRYDNDISKLNAAWKTSLKGFEEAKVPSPERQKAADMSEFRTPAAFQYEIDYTESLAALISGIIDELCKTVKESSDRRLISGTYYGYTTYLNGAFRGQQTGHYALRKLLASPHLDILMAPSRYAGRRLGGATGFMFPDGSVNMYGKLIISECDDRPMNASSGTFRSGSLKSSRSVFERAVALQLYGSAVMRYFDFSKGWVMDEPRLLDVVRKTVEFDTACRVANPEPMAAENSAAVFSSERTMAILNPTSLLQHQLLENGYAELASSGMSFHVFNLEDIAKVHSDRKMLVFANCFRLTGEEKQAVKAAIAGKNVLVTSGLGLFNDGGKADLNFMREIFGCEFKHSPERKVRVSKATAEMEKLFGIPQGTVFRASVEIGDVFYPQGGKFIPLAKSDDGNTAIAAFIRDGKVHIYAAHPVMPAALLKALARKSGMPVIDAGKAAVWFGSAYGMVHTDKEVTAAVEVPAGYRGIVEYPDLKYVSAEQGKVIRKLGPAETWMFYLKK